MKFGLPVNNWEKQYEVSNLGRLKRLYKNKKEPKISVGYKHSSKYIMTKLGGYTSILMHRLVAIHFIPNLENKQFVNHKNGIKNDNRADNLEWVTKNENMQHAWDTGLRKIAPLKGERNGTSKLKNGDIINIRILLKYTTLTHSKIGKLFGVSPGTISQINIGKIWKHI